MILLKAIKINNQVVLCATDEESEIALRKAEGKVLAVKTERARSPQHHRLFFALLKQVYDFQDQFKSIDDLRDATLIEIGHSELREGFGGERWRTPKSIAFHKCDQDKFNDIFRDAVDSWCKHFDLDPDQLLNQAPIGRQHHG